jgi:hypothetical protein
MSVETDSHGRLYLSSELRQKYGERFQVFAYDDRIELIPTDEDPLKAVRGEIGDALEGKSREELREEALDRANRKPKTTSSRQSEIRGTGLNDGFRRD